MTPENHQHRPIRAAGEAAVKPMAIARRRPGQAGFALVAVIWGLGLATLLGSAVIVGSRFRARDVDTLADGAQSTVAAESAVLFGIRKAMDGDPRFLQRRAIACILPDGARATLLITPESGKVDLNTASPALLARLFIGLMGEPRAGSAVAQAVVAFRDNAGRGQPAPPGSDPVKDNKPPAFTTVLALDQVPGLSTDLLFRALPFVTVGSGKPDIDRHTAAPALLALLGLPPDQNGRPTAITAGDVTVHAEVRTAKGAWAVRDALVAIGPGAAFAIREWRVSRRDPASVPDAAAQACLP